MGKSGELQNNEERRKAQRLKQRKIGTERLLDSAMEEWACQDCGEEELKFWKISSRMRSL